jgi:hypothetical protein
LASEGTCPSEERKEAQRKGRKGGREGGREGKGEGKRDLVPIGHHLPILPFLPTLANH